MDPFSFATSIAGLLSLAGSVVSVGYKLSSRATNNMEDLKVLIDETAAFSGILLGVKSHIESHQSVLGDPDIMTKQLEYSQHTLTGISNLLDKMSTESRLVSLFKDEGRGERLEKLRKRLENNKTFFMLYFALQNSTHSGTIKHQMQTVIKNLEALNLSQAKVETGVETLVKEEQQKRLEKIYQWLGLETDTEHKDLCQRRDPYSGQWILERNEFEAWLSSEGSSFFWLNGTQGSGKSVIVSRIITTIQETYLEEGGSALAYHYCRFSNLQSLSPSHLLGSFIGQLLRQSPNPDGIVEIVGDMYEKHQKKSTYPRFEDLQFIFMEICQTFENTFIIIDGLDEMQDRWSILDFLESMPQLSDKLKILVASRAEMDIENAFSFYCTVTITPNDVASDIERFVRKQLDSRRFRGTQVDEIVSALVTQADGMFLWVVCQIDHLLHVRTKITPRLLQALPRSLERTFEQTFLKLEEEDRVLTKRVLQFIMLSNKALDLPELIEAIAISPDTKTLRDVKDNKLAREKDVFELCGSLIRQSHSTRKIELAHYSVYTFLRATYLEGNRPNQLYIEESQGNKELLLACTRYLSMADVCSAGLPAEFEEAFDDDDTYVDPEVFSNTVFLEHATNSWPIYMSRLSDAELKDVWSPVLIAFMQSNEQSFNFWVRIARYIHGAYKYPRGMTPLDATALHGLPELARLLMSDSHLQEASWQPSMSTRSFRTPLHIAIENNREEMIDILMLPSYMASTDEKGQTPLHLALQSANDLAVTQLITGGSDVNSKDNDGRTPVFISIENMWESSVSLLSEMADPRVTMPDKRGPLHLAAQAGSSVWMTHLLQFHNNLVNEADQLGWTPLHYAADRGHGSIVKILLSKGADKKLEDQNGWTPLHATILRENMDCLDQILTSEHQPRQLLSPLSVRGRRGGGSNLSSQELVGKYSTSSQGGSSHTGASGSSSNPTHGLSSSSASSPDQDPIVTSPMLLAVSNNFISGVKSLLRHAEFYGRYDIGLNEQDGSCLRKALSLPDMDILQLLLPISTASSILAVLPEIAAEKEERIAKVVQQNLSSQWIHKEILPQMIANKKVNSHVIEWLLDLWPPEMNTLPTDILHIIAGRFLEGGKHIALRLIEGGAGKFDMDRDRQTPLQSAIKANNWDMVFMFIEKDMVDIHSIPNALHTLFDGTEYRAEDTDKILEVADRLLEAGIDINSTDDAGIGICHKLASLENSALIDWALINNASPSIIDNRGSTAISVAAAFSRENNMRALLSQIVHAQPEEMLRILTSSGARRPPMTISTENHNIPILVQLIEADQAAAAITNSTADPSTHILRSKIFTDALCHAIKRGFYSGALHLVDAMADISSLNSAGETPLHVAVRQEDERFIRILLERGASVNSRAASNNESPYTVAAKKDRPWIMEILDEYGANTQLGDMRIAVETRNEHMLSKVLQEYPDELDAQREALFWARSIRNSTAEGMLLRIVTSREFSFIQDGISRDVYGDTVLHQEIRKLEPDQDLISTLAQNNAILHAKDTGGDSALMLAIRLGRWGSTKTLASAGADIAEALDKSRDEKCDLWVTKLLELNP